MPDDLLEHFADVLRADEDGSSAGEGIPPPVRELAVAPHGVLELGAVRLDGVACAACRAHGPAEEDMVREDEVGRQVLTECGRVRFDIPLTLVGGQLGQ
jgi:hypothetical protein